MITPYNDEYFMRQAYLEAQKAFELGEIPVGAVVVVNQQVIARAHNLTERLPNILAENT
jgi:tRNA(adenine34) deaminase